MNKIPGLFGVAALIFTLGIFSGNLITLPSKTSPAANSMLTDATDTQAAQADLESLPDNWALDQPPISNASFADFVETKGEDSGSSILLTSATAASDAADTQQIRDAIVEEFPDLDTATLDGWVAGYAGMSLQALRPLLEQRRLLPSIVPSPALSEFGSVAEQPKQSNSEVFRNVCQQNLDNAFTVGYRRQTRLAQLTDSASVSTKLLSGFDFSFGHLQTSNSTLHLAIEESPNLFFLLNPGQVLTRCGAFDRFENGSIGIMQGETELVVEGTTNLPYEATSIEVERDGTITFSDVEGESQSAGQVVLVKVKDLSSLTSSNGVYFTIPEANAHSIEEMKDQNCVVSGTLESSNVDSDVEWKHLEHFQKLSSNIEQ